MQDISARETLDAIGLRHGTDKASNLHAYLDFYAKRFEYLRDEAFVFMEIGVLNGASVAMWAEYFPRALIVGVDYTPECAKFATDRIKIAIGDAGEPAFLHSLVERFGAPRIIIDDASHRWDHQILALQTFFPLLPPGGHFVIEDIDTSFEGQLKKARFQGHSGISGFDYVYKLARVVVAEGALAPEMPYDQFIATHARNVSTIELHRRTAMINKKR